MNVKRFTARTARDALALVREALGEDAVVLSTRPAPEGVEVLALAPEGMAKIEQAARQQARAAAPAAPAAQPVLLPAATPATPRPSLAERIAARGERLEPRVEPRLEPALAEAGGGRAEPRYDAARVPTLTESVADDVETLGMSTLTFQDYVRERMLKRRQAELAQQAPASLPEAMQAQAAPAQPAPPLRVVASEGRRAEGAEPLRHQALRDRIAAAPARREVPVLRDEIRLADRVDGRGEHRAEAPGRLRLGAEPGPGQHDLLADAGVAAAAPRERQELMGELRSVRALIEERFGMLAFMERLQRDPRQAALSQKLFDAGFSPALVRKLVQALPADRQQVPDELAWAAGVLERNVHTDEREAPLEDHQGVLALIGPTGVGKTTSTAKLAAAFATKHGAANLGLITLDAYRVAAHEQLRAYGRILGVPVHTAHDRASLEDLLELLSAKRLVLIDTAGMAQRDSRTQELLDMLQHPAIQKLLVVNAAAQGETVEDVMVGYRVQQCAGVVVSKLDEAVKLGPALDALIRHRAKVVGVANGQRVPEDWHRLSAQALVQRALKGGGTASWKLDAGEVNLVFAATQGAGYPAPLHA